MAGYKSLHITGNTAGLVQQRQEFLLPNDAYPVLQNSYVFRERLLRKRGYQLLGRLQRDLSSLSLGNILWASAGTFTFNIFTLSGLITTEPNASIVPGTLILTIDAPINNVLTDNGDGTMTISGGGTTIDSATVNYSTSEVTITTNASGGSSADFVTMSYFPGLPVMGIRIEEQRNSELDQTVFFDQKYAYIFDGNTLLFKEFIPGTTWNAGMQGLNGTDFFFSTNYFVSGQAFSPFGTANNKLFWVTNGSGGEVGGGDPPRITDGVTWVSFNQPFSGGIGGWNRIDATNFLFNFLTMLPFRGRMVTFNTFEGTVANGAKNYPNRIRWSTIGNPFIPYTSGPPAAGSWRDDIRGQGGFLDVPTSEDILAVGFVRDNLVIYTERSTWQLRYTGRAISPFQVERVNSELGSESTFSAIQFDTSLLGIGDKGIVRCDSYKAEKIDIKIPDFVWNIQSINGGGERIQGVRNFETRLAFWTIPLANLYDPALLKDNQIYPNQRLVYNYENESWALFNDSLTALGTFQTLNDRTWLNTPEPWVNCNFNWIDQPSGDPEIVGGNQQGFIEYLDQLVTNDVSLAISNITADNITATVVTSQNHNMQTGFVIGISAIPSGTPFSSLNGGIFGIVVLTANTFSLMLYNTDTGQFSTPQINTDSGFVGYGLINIRENFSIVSKKFNFLDDGENIQLGYLDILMSATGQENPGSISLNVYLNYDDDTFAQVPPASNTFPNNVITGSIPQVPDTFFNSIIPTYNTANGFNNIQGSKFWQRVYCATRANFLTLQYTFSNAQMAGLEQELDVEIDAQILWLRKAGRMTNI